MDFYSIIGITLLLSIERSRPRSESSHIRSIIFSTYKLSLDMCLEEENIHEKVLELCSVGFIDFLRKWL